MEFYLVRALEIGRLSKDQISQLHEEEDKTFPVMIKTRGYNEAQTYLAKRALFSFEVEQYFKLPTYLNHYHYKKNSLPLENYLEKIRKRLAKLRLSPEWDFLILDVDMIHRFDRSIYLASTEKRIVFNS